MKVFPERPWEVYQYSSNGRPVYCTFYADANKLAQAEYPHCARVRIPIKAPGPSGGPHGDEVKVLWAMEDEVTAALEQSGVKCVMVGRLTFDDERELVYQLHDWETFRPPVGRWMQTRPDYDIGVSEHEGWKFFFDCVWPTDNAWQWIMDRRVVDSLKKNGSDLSKEHDLEFVFRGKAGALEQLRERLAARSYTLLDFSPGEERLVMVKRMVPVVGDICAESLGHKRNTEELGAEYDGWGCRVVK